MHKLQIGIDPSGIQRLTPASKIILCLVDRLCTVYSFVGLLARLITSSAYGRTISRIRFSSPSVANLTVEITFRRYSPRSTTKPRRRGTIMKYVYLLQSLSVPNQRYVGVTTNLNERLQAHNAGTSSHTSRYRAWKVVTYICFQDDRRAAEFERYLKTGSGQAFANKRLW